jgi:hypothetical protein
MLPLFLRSLLPTSRFSGQTASQRTESRPPVPSRAAGSGSDWRSSLWRRARLDAVAAARLDFAEALVDVPTAGSARVLDRIAVSRSLHDLWHLREEVFSFVSCRHSQMEAKRRLASLDRHFPKRTYGSESAGRF